MMKALALPDNYREGNLHEAPAPSMISAMADTRKYKTERRKKSSSIEYGFLNRAAASTGVIPTRMEATNSFEYMLSDDDGEDGKADAAKGPGPAEVEIKAGEKRSRDAAFKKHSCSLDAQSLGEKRGTRDRSCSIPAHVSFVPLSLGSSAPEQLPSSSQSEDEDEEDPALTPSTTTSTTTTPRSPLSGSRTMSRRGLSISLPASNSPPRMLPTISPRDLSFVMSDLEEEIERIERSEPKQLTPRCSAPNAVEMAIGGPMVPIALPPQQQEKKPSGLTKESKKTPPSPTTVGPVTVIPRPQRRPIESIIGSNQTASGPSVWLPKLNLGALGVGDDLPITSPDRSRSVPNILSPRSAFSPRMSPRVGLIPSGPSVNV